MRENLDWVFLHVGIRNWSNSKRIQMILSLLCLFLPLCQKQACYRGKNWHLLQGSHSKENLELEPLLFNKLKEQWLLQIFCGIDLRQSRTKSNVPYHNNGTQLHLEGGANSSQKEELFYLQYAIRLLPQRENNVLNQSATLIDYLPWKEASWCAGLK